MKCICKNCSHCQEHNDGKICDKHLVFVHEDDYCEEWENETLFNVSKLVAFTIIVIGITILLSKIL